MPFKVAPPYCDYRNSDPEDEGDDEPPITLFGKIIISEKGKVRLDFGLKVLLNEKGRHDMCFKLCSGTCIDHRHVMSQNRNLPPPPPFPGGGKHISL